MYRGDIDEPIAIDEIKKFIADKELDSDVRYIPPKRYHLAIRSPLSAAALQDFPARITLP